MPHRNPAKPAPTTTVASTSAPSGIKRRIPQSNAAQYHGRATMRSPEEERRLLVDREALDSQPDPEMVSTTWASRNQWIVLALASGGCAAFNGVFAKLHRTTTTELTTTLSQGLARFLGLSALEGGIELIVRGIFFALNLFFNGVMWALFTKALTRGNSTTQVSIINTSSNFVITAILGFAIFSEALPPLWWAGAAMLVAGNVIIGRKDEGKKQENDDDAGSRVSHDDHGAYRPIPQTNVDGPAAVLKNDEDVLDLELDEA